MKARQTIVPALPLLLAAGAAWPHPLAGAADAAGSWRGEAWVEACLALSLLMYAAGAARLYARSRLGRPQLLRRLACFGAGWLASALALASPLDAAGSLSFAAHMVQHELLMIVAAPLLVLGRPLGVWLWAWPAALRRGGGTISRMPWLHLAWRALTRPLNAWLLHFAALWLWHVPAWFQLALRHPGWHALQHASFLFPALLFWWAVLGQDKTPRGSAMAYLFTTMLHTGALGALLALSGNVWYPAYGGTAAEYGLSALEDQQLGGLIMWVPGGLAYLIAALLLCAGWLASPRAAQPAQGARP
jgi:putative membrane protein